MITRNEGLVPIHVPTCPICGHKISLARKAKGDKPGQPSSLFWGEPGTRFKLCHMGAWFHFVVIKDGKQLHRLAYLAGAAEPPENPEPWPTGSGQAKARATENRITIQQQFRALADELGGIVIEEGV